MAMLDSGAIGCEQLPVRKVNGYAWNDIRKQDILSLRHDRAVPPPSLDVGLSGEMK